MCVCVYPVCVWCSYILFHVTPSLPLPSLSFLFSFLWIWIYIFYFLLIYKDLEMDDDIWYIFIIYKTQIICDLLHYMSTCICVCVHFIWKKKDDSYICVICKIYTTLYIHTSPPYLLVCCDIVHMYISHIHMSYTRRWCNRHKVRVQTYNMKCESVKVCELPPRTTNLKTKQNTNNKQLSVCVCVCVW